MKRSKKLTVLLAVLLAAILATVGMSLFQKKTEQIKNSDAVILQIPADTVTALSWDYDGETLSFHKDGVWLWDGDSAFPVDQEKLADFLSRFEAFGVSFVIEDVEDYGQYGLEDPVCAVRLTAGERSVELKLGDFSQMDSKRYVSIGDGNVYLVSDDPLEDYDASISELIANDQLPSFENVSAVTFSGAESYEILREEDSGLSPCAGDVYFTRRGGKTLPLDTDLVEGYLANITLLDAKDYVTYNATAEELAEYGLDAPELTVAVTYSAQDADGEEQPESFTLSLGRNPQDAAKAEAREEDAGDAEAEDIPAYIRVGDSPIVYKIDSGSYDLLRAASYDDLRHKELLTADFDTVTRLDISLEGEDYTLLASQNEDGETVWSYGQETPDITALRSRLTGLAAESFTSEAPGDKLEIGLTVHLDNESFPTLRIDLYRYDGSSCLAALDGEPAALVPRSGVVDLIEAVHAIVLGGASEAE